MVNYDKAEIKDLLTIEDIFSILEDFGGEPFYSSKDIIVSKTICHHDPKEEASHKLYYYSNSRSFTCYSHCGSGWDIFELIQKISKIQWNKEINLNEAVRWVASRIGYTGESIQTNDLEDWDCLKEYEEINNITINNDEIILKEFDNSILNNFNYDCILLPWIKDGITIDAMKKANIGFYPGEDKITIPHYDINDRFIGLRGRTMCKEEAELYGKYRPLKINNIQYSHPLGFNLYGLNINKENIKRAKKAIIVEGEKSVLLADSFLGSKNNICVATCGSSLSSYQVKLLLDLGVNEIVIGYDKQWQEENDDEYKLWTKKLKKINDKYSSLVTISFMFDNKNLLGYKDSPFDRGRDIALTLFKERIII